MTYADMHYDWTGVLFVIEKSARGSDIASWRDYEFYGPFAGVDYMSYWMRLQDFWDTDNDCPKDGRRFFDMPIRAPSPIPAPADRPEKLPGAISRDRDFSPEKMYFDYWTYPPRVKYEKEYGPTGQVQKRKDHLEAE